MLYNRLDCCSERLNGVLVSVYSGSKVGYVPCGHVLDATAYQNGVLRIKCPKPIRGNKVKVTIPGSFLALCEVQVMGTPLDSKYQPSH